MNHELYDCDIYSCKTLCKKKTDWHLFSTPFYLLDALKKHSEFSWCMPQSNQPPYRLVVTSQDYDFLTLWKTVTEKYFGTSAGFLQIYNTVLEYKKNGI
jgi:hypothetical protein